MFRYPEARLELSCCNSPTFSLYDRRKQLDCFYQKKTAFRTIDRPYFRAMDLELTFGIELEFICVYDRMTFTNTEWPDLFPGRWLGEDGNLLDMDRDLRRWRTDTW